MGQNGVLHEALAPLGPRHLGCHVAPLEDVPRQLDSGRGMGRGEQAWGAGPERGPHAWPEGARHAMAQRRDGWHADSLRYADGAQDTRESRRDNEYYQRHAGGKGEPYPLRQMRMPETQPLDIQPYGPGHGHAQVEPGRTKPREVDRDRGAQWHPHEGGFHAREGEGGLLAPGVAAGLGVGVGSGMAMGHGGGAGMGWGGGMSREEAEEARAEMEASKRKVLRWLATAADAPVGDVPPPDCSPAMRRSISHIYPQGQAEALRDAMHRSHSFRHEVRPARPGPRPQGAAPVHASPYSSASQQQRSGGPHNSSSHERTPYDSPASARGWGRAPQGSSPLGGARGGPYDEDKSRSSRKGYPGVKEKGGRGNGKGETERDGKQRARKGDPSGSEFTGRAWVQGKPANGSGSGIGAGRTKSGLVRARSGGAPLADAARLSRTSSYHSPSPKGAPGTSTLGPSTSPLGAATPPLLRSASGDVREDSAPRGGRGSGYGHVGNRNRVSPSSFTSPAPKSFNSQNGSSVNSHTGSGLHEPGAGAPGARLGNPWGAEGKLSRMGVQEQHVRSKEHAQGQPPLPQQPSGKQPPPPERQLRKFFSHSKRDWEAATPETPGEALLQKSSPNLRDTADQERGRDGDGGGDGDSEEEGDGGSGEGQGKRGSNQGAGQAEGPVFSLAERIQRMRGFRGSLGTSSALRKAVSENRRALDKVEAPRREGAPAAGSPGRPSPLGGVRFQLPPLRPGSQRSPVPGGSHRAHSGPMQSAPWPATPGARTPSPGAQGAVAPGQPPGSVSPHKGLNLSAASSFPAVSSSPGPEGNRQSGPAPAPEGAVSPSDRDCGSASVGTPKPNSGAKVQWHESARIHGVLGVRGEENERERGRGSGIGAGSRSGVRAKREGGKSVSGTAEQKEKKRGLVWGRAKAKRAGRHVSNPYVVKDGAGCDTGALEEDDDDDNEEAEGEEEGDGEEGEEVPVERREAEEEPVRDEAEEDSEVEEEILREDEHGKRAADGESGDAEHTESVGGQGERGTDNDCSVEAERAGEEEEEGEEDEGESEEEEGRVEEGEEWEEEWEEEDWGEDGHSEGFQSDDGGPNSTICSQSAYSAPAGRQLSGPDGGLEKARSRSSGPKEPVDLLVFDLTRDSDSRSDHSSDHSPNHSSPNGVPYCEPVVRHGSPHPRRERGANGTRGRREEGPWGHGEAVAGMMPGDQGPQRWDGHAMGWGPPDPLRSPVASHPGFAPPVLGHSPAYQGTSPPEAVPYPGRPPAHPGYTWPPVEHSTVYEAASPPQGAAVPFPGRPPPSPRACQPVKGCTQGGLAGQASSELQAYEHQWGAQHPTLGAGTGHLVVGATQVPSNVAHAVHFGIHGARANGPWEDQHLSGAQCSEMFESRVLPRGPGY